MRVNFELGDPEGFTEYIFENRSDPRLRESVSLASRWAGNTVAITRQYDGAIQQDLRQGLLLA